MDTGTKFAPKVCGCGQTMTMFSLLHFWMINYSFQGKPTTYSIYCSHCTISLVTLLHLLYHFFAHGTINKEKQKHDIANNDIILALPGIVEGVIWPACLDRVSWLLSPHTKLHTTARTMLCGCYNTTILPIQYLNELWYSLKMYLNINVTKSHQVSLTYHPTKILYTGYTKFCTLHIAQKCYVPCCSMVNPLPE